MRTTLSLDHVAERLDTLTDDNLAFQRQYPGEGPHRQPVHTVYEGAHLLQRGFVARWAAEARASLEAFGPEAFTFAHALGLPGVETLPVGGSSEALALTRAFEADPSSLAATRREAWLALTVYTRMREKLQREPIEDFRVDFEDGYGPRSAEEEDAAALHCGDVLAEAMAEGALPPYVGIRVKPLTEGLKARSIRTLDLCLTRLLERSGGVLPEGFIVTLAKIQHVGQVEIFVALLARLERELGLAAGSVKLELMVELAQNIIDPRGRSLLPEMFAAAGPRCIGAHLGVYDYTASCGITAAHQGMDHPCCDFARDMMQVALAGTGVRISDGATHALPIPPHPTTSAETEQIRENAAAVHRAWRLACEQTWHSLRGGIYQGWDLHPAQLPARYAANYAFFLDGLAAATSRLSSFVQQASAPTVVGEVVDDAATGQALLNTITRAWSCGAITEGEVTATGLSPDEVRGRTFAEILAARRG